MSQYDFGVLSPGPTSGTELADHLRQWRDALHSGHLGAARPAYLKAGATWSRQLDADTIQVLLWDGTGDREIGRLNILTDVWTPYMGGAPLGSAATKGTGTDAGEVIELAVGGKIPIGVGRTMVQRVVATNETHSSVANIIFSNDTIPQNTAGAEILSVEITPTSSTNRLLIRAEIAGSISGGSIWTAALFQDAVANALVARPISVAGFSTLPLTCEIAAGSTGAMTFKVRAGPNGGTFYLNGTAAGRVYGGVSICNLIVEEYAS